MKYYRVLSGGVAMLSCLATALLCLGTSSAQTPTITKLQKYTIDPSKTAVVGVSAGGAMAIQLDVAFSKTFHDVAVYAGVPYYCGQNDIFTVMTACMDNSKSDNPDGLAKTTESWAASGAIDPVSNLAGQKAYVWTGTKDSVIMPSIVKDVQNYYQHFGVPVTLEDTYPAAHGWESPDGEVACDTFKAPYVINCGSYDSEKTWLTLFYGALNPRNSSALTGSLIRFDQTEFGSRDALLDQAGYVYVPQSCASGQSCKLVVALVGCQMSNAEIGTKFITESGIDPWADTNGIIVLYPGTVVSDNNPNSCFDWWGYTNGSYAQKSGSQMAAIMKMVARIQGP